MKLKTFSTQGPNSPRRPLARCLSACVAALSLVTSVAQASLPGTPVGEVSMILGKAWIEKPGAPRERVTDGTQVGVFDKIETDSDGHVHIRFVDGGLFSVRPYSTLEIERYDYNAARPEESAVKLNLLEGEARSISGDAAHKARENYRINTPIAAIGVRGTDFVISAGRGEVEARINEGAIVVTPFSSQCLADTLSICNTNGQELAYGASQMLQLAANASNPVLLPASYLPASSLNQSPPQQQPQGQIASNSIAAPAAVVGGREERSSGELYTESVTSLAVTRTLASKPPTPTPGPIVSPTPTPVVEPEFTPDALVSAQTLQANQLLWARSYDPARPYDRITVPLTLALSINMRKGTIATPSSTYTMFRTLSDLPRVQPNMGIVGFTLNSAQAMYTSGSGVELLDVNKGLLSINFNESTFATELAMRSATLGAVGFSANGRIIDGGIFTSIGTKQEMAGAVTFDGKEAGYYFEKTIDTGTLEGLTLWGRQP
jgi:hypothetical protein